MAYIKKLKNNELIGGTDNTDVYPVTSTKAVFDENNVSQDYLNKHITGDRIESNTISGDKLINKAVTEEKVSDALMDKINSAAHGVTEEFETEVREALEKVVNTVSVNNGTPIQPVNKNINITVPENLAKLNTDEDHRTVTDTEKSTWNGKQDALTFDNVPTANSNNPVKSGGVYQAIQSIDVSDQISDKADKSEMSVVAGTGANADKTTITLKNGTSATVLTQHQDVSGKEDKSNKVTSFSSPTDTQYPSAKLVNDQLATKQNTISDLATIRSGASAGATAYQKPGTGIPSTDLASAVQTSLGKADTAIQSVTVGTTTTGAAGTNASVTNTGTATEPVLSFTIPQGAQGIQGIQGPQGERGPQGNTGVQVDSVASIIHSIDPTATYAAADVAGADAVQDVLSEVTELAGEVALGAVYDVSVHNNNATFASLSALLSDANLDTLIPTSVRKGGMSIKYVQSSDNTYVQYRYTLEYSNTTAGNRLFADSANWQGDEVRPFVVVQRSASGSQGVAKNMPKGKKYLFKNTGANNIINIELKTGGLYGTVVDTVGSLAVGEYKFITTTGDGIDTIRCVGTPTYEFSIYEEGSLTFEAYYVTTLKITDKSVTREKLSSDIKNTINSPFSLDGTIVGNNSCISNIKVYTTNKSDLEHTYYISKVSRVDNNVDIIVLQDSTAVARLLLSEFTPVNNRNRFTIGTRNDNSLIVDITVDWSILTAGTNISPNYQIKKENIILVENMNHLNLRVYQGHKSYFAEAIKKVEMRCLSESDITTPYRLYNCNKTASSLSIRVYKGTNYEVVTKTLETGNEIVLVEAFNIKITFDCSLIPNGTSTGVTYYADIIKRGSVEYNEATDGYLSKDTIIDVFKDVFYVDCNRTSNSGQWFNSISEACAHVRSISPNKHQKQFEIIVMPGVYHECGILVPPYTHIHGTSKDAVVVTDTDYSGDDHSCFFDFGTAAKDVAWHSDGRYGKLSNMTLRETQGRYCIHASQPYMCGLLENIAFEHYLCTTGPRANLNFVIGVGCGYSGNLFTFDGCSFKSFGHRGKVTGHTVRLTTYGNCRLNFRNCLFVNTNLSYGSIGSCGNLIIEINGCSFINGSELLAEFTANAIQPYQYLSDLYEINFIGGNNKHLVANLPCDGATVCVEKDTPLQGDTLYIKGSIVDALFGGVNYKNGGTFVTAKAIGSLYVKDAKNASNADVFQMWKRLGDCSTTAKTMTVSINGGTEQVVTLNGNYASTKPAESSIIAEINAQLNGVTFKKFSITNRYLKLNTTEKELIIMQQDVEKFACVNKDGVVCGSGSTDVHGIVLEDTAINDVAPVWTGYGIYTGMADGDYAVGTNGTLVSSTSNVVFICSNGVLRRKRDD